MVCLLDIEKRHPFISLIISSIVGIGYRKRLIALLAGGASHTKRIEPPFFGIISAGKRCWTFSDWFNNIVSYQFLKIFFNSTPHMVWYASIFKSNWLYRCVYVDRNFIIFKFAYMSAEYFWSF